MGTKSNYQDLYSIEGLQFVPVNEHKQPLIKDWQTSHDVHDLSKCYGVGLVCGEPSGNVEIIDIDLKYDLSGDLFDRYKRLINSADPTLLKVLVVQKTKNNGYHFVYRCSRISGNTKLANRYSTEEEKNITYNNTYKSEVEKGKSDENARKVATKSRDNDKVKVLLETRGIGGQFVIHPTPGYEFIYGDLCSITEITPEQRDILFSCAMQLNEVFEEQAAPTKIKHQSPSNGLSPFDDYNERGDVISLLVDNGWKIVKTKGSKTHLLRPGQSTAQTSGNFDHEKNWFSVFTTSTEFEPMKAYLPYAVFAILECNKDFSLASKKLFELGFGDRKREDTKSSTRVIESRIDIAKVDKSLFAQPSDYDGFLKSVIDGTLKMGLTTGSPELDKHFLFKEGDLVMTNGIDNVGKSEIGWWLLLIATMYHGWRFVIFSSENTVGAFMRRMIQFYWGKSIRVMTPDEYQIAKKFVEDHFIIIKAQEQLYNYKDIINLVKIARQEYGNFNGGMIDPYNSLKINLSGFSKLNTHEYHYEAISEIKSYGQQTIFSWWINHHAVTSAIRLKDADRKYSVAPRKEDTEGGGKMANKADQFLTIHRITNHPTEWMNTEIHVRKVKDTETGGLPTSIDEPVKFQRYKGGYAYCEKLPDGSLGIDPIEEWHIQNNGFISSKKILTQQDIWTPYSDDNKDDSNDMPTLNIDF